MTIVQISFNQFILLRCLLFSSHSLSIFLSVYLFFPSIFLLSSSLALFQFSSFPLFHSLFHSPPFSVFQIPRFYSLFLILWALSLYSSHTSIFVCLYCYDNLSICLFVWFAGLSAYQLFCLSVHSWNHVAICLSFLLVLVFTNKVFVYLSW